MKPLHTLTAYNLNRFEKAVSNLFEIDLLSNLNVIFTTVGCPFIGGKIKKGGL
jgi:hypothetical protein